MKVESFSIGSKHYINEDRLVVRDLGLLGIICIMRLGTLTSACEQSVLQTRVIWARLSQ